MSAWRSAAQAVPLQFHRSLYAYTPKLRTVIEAIQSV